MRLGQILRRGKITLQCLSGLTLFTLFESSVSPHSRLAAQPKEAQLAKKDSTQTSAGLQVPSSSNAPKPSSPSQSSQTREKTSKPTDLLGITESKRIYTGTLIGVIHALAAAASVTRLGYVAYFKQPANRNIVPFLMIGVCAHLYFAYFQEAVVGLEVDYPTKTVKIVKGITAQKKNLIKFSNIRLVEGNLDSLRDEMIPGSSFVMEFRQNSEAAWSTGLILPEAVLNTVFSGRFTDRHTLRLLLENKLDQPVQQTSQKIG